MPVNPVRILISVRLLRSKMPFTFSVAEYADTIYVYGFCDGNSLHAVAEYQQRFPNRRIPNRRVFTRVYQTLRDTGTLPGVRIAAEHGVNGGVDEEEGIVQMLQSSPHAQRVQYLGPGDFAKRLEFCKWLNGSHQLHCYILFTDEAHPVY